jgi:hypothetical protein
VELSSSIYGKPIQYSLDDATLGIASEKSTRTIRLGEVRGARLAQIGTLRMCELTLVDGSKASIIGESPAPALQPFVEAVHARLVELGQPVQYTRGSWFLVIIMIVVGVCVIAAAQLLRAGAPLTILGFVWMIAGPIVAWRSRPRAYDPRASLDILR